MNILLKITFILLASFSLMGQVSKDTITVDINPTPPKVSIKAIPNVIYTGDSTIVSASGCNGTIIWNVKLPNGNNFWENNKKIDFPTKTTWFKAYCQSVAGCKGLLDSIQVIVKANIPKIIASPAEICQGKSTTLTASDCINGVYKWSTGVTANSIIVSPIQSTSYEVFCMNVSGTSEPTKVNVTVYPTPAKISISTNPTVIYTGDSTIVTTKGCSDSIYWVGIDLTLTNNFGIPRYPPIISDRPTKTKWYKAYCVSPQFCEGPADSVQVIVKANIPKVVASAAEICQGEKSTLTASGCVNGTYKWSTGVTGNSIIVTPSQTTSYEVVCENISGISEPAIVKVTVKNSPPAPTLSASKININTGETVNLYASGCYGSVVWSNGQKGTTISVTPTQTTTYKAHCNENGCDGAESSITIGVYSPIPTIEGSHKEICAGNEVTLTAFGCNGSINWSTGANNTITIKVNPTQTTTYEAVCNTTAGSSAPAKFTVTVYGYPSAPSVNGATIVVGNYATLNASGCSGSYLWSTGAISQSITVNPTNYTEYKVRCIQNGCPSPEATAAVNVISPNSEVWASPDKICKGESTKLFAKGCNGTYKWSTGETGESISVKPTQTTQYNLLCSTNAGDGSPAYVTVTVFDIPNKPVIFGDTLITSGKTATLKAVCSSSAVKWNTGATTETITVKPSVTTWYKAFCTSAQGCIGATDSIRVKVSTPPIVIVPEDKPVKLVNKRKAIEICEGEKPKLNLIGCETSSKVVWNTGETTRLIFVSPIKNTSYWASCTDIVGTKYDSLDVIVFPKPKITLSSATDTVKTISGKPTTLKVLGCNGKVTWIADNNVNIQVSSDTLQVIPTVPTKIYKAFCTNLNGCNSDSLKIVVVAIPPKPKLEVIEDGKTLSKVTICEGSNVEIKASGCPSNTNYIWDILRGDNTKESFKGDVYNGVFSQKNTYVVYCSYKENSNIRGDTVKLVLTPTPITLENVIVYPNPTYDVIKITSDGCLHGVKLKLWDISGRLLYDGVGIEENNILQLSLGDLPSAEYVLQIISDEARKTINKLILKANKK
jgi:large repetitive protein